MMGRSHLAVNGAIAAAGFVWLSALRDPSSVPASFTDAWVYDTASRVTGLVGQGVPAWVGEHAVSSGAGRLWAWLFPLWDGGQFSSVAYLVVATLLLALGTVLPDADSKDSTLGRRLPFPVPGPHRGLLHSDWVLIALFVTSLAPPTRVLVWLWLGAWLHCEVDGLSTSGRVRFYPLTNYRLKRLPSGEVCVGRTGRYVSLYQAGTTGETVLLGGMLAACGLVFAAALRL